MRKAVVAGFIAVALTACGGGGGDASVSPIAGPGPAPIPVPEPIPSPVVLTPLQQAQAFFASLDANSATAPPATGAQLTSLTDGCSLHNGYTKAAAIAEFDADPARGAASNKYRVGSTRSNVQVLADRETTNTDSSARRELDVQYQINYADGTNEVVSKETLISGSSFGSKITGNPDCATPETGTNLRSFGNREIVSSQVRAINQRSERYTLATGAPFAVPVDYSKFVQFRIADAGKLATYVVVTGAGLPASGLKMISPRILRDDPLLAGKRGNFVDWKDTDPFRICRADIGGGNFAATAADCTAFGVSSNNFGIFNQTPAKTDTDFAVFGFIAGSSYNIAVYNDDGWKTVNGQAAKTPVATYSRQLTALPYSAVTLAGTGVAADLFPRITASASSAAMATGIRSKAPVSVNLTWNALGALPDAAVFGWGDIYNFVSGRAAPATSSFPGSRRIEFTYPNTGATSAANFSVGSSPTEQAALVTPTYAEFGLELANRKGSRVLSLITFE